MYPPGTLKLKSYIMIGYCGMPKIFPENSIRSYLDI